MEAIKGLGGIYYLLIVLAAMVAVERVVPWRKGLKLDLARWLRNASMTVYGTILLSALPAIAAYGAAAATQERGFGLLNLIDMPLAASLAISILVLDLTAYAQHRMLHHWHILWRTHRAHHTDLEIDATTALRFHPLETLFRALIEVPVVVLFGVPPEGVLLIYIVHVAVNAFTHANVALPEKLDIALSKVVTTPSVHRQHHSVAEEKQRMNYGTAFTIWDRLFGTFLGPEHLETDERFGVEGEEAPPAETFGNLALDPFRKAKTDAAPAPLAPQKAQG